MDRLVKEMLKLIEEEGDSFAKKAEMYYKRRPELVAHVENFYRMYRALAERYDNVTGELRKNIPAGLQSPGSTAGSDLGSEPPSPPRSPSPEQTSDRKFSRSQSRARAAGFDFFLGSGGRAGSRKGSETSSSSESESASESDEVKEMGGDLDPNHVCPRMVQLESELQEVKDKLQQYEQISDEGVLPSRVAELEAELTAANQKLQGSQEVINQLRQDLEKKTQVGFELGGLSRKQRSDDGERHAAAETGPVDRELSMDELKASAEMFSHERLMLDAKMSEQAQAIEKLNEMLTSSSGKFSEEKLKLEKDILSLSESNASLQATLARLGDERRQLELGQTAEEVCAPTEKRIEELNQNLDALKQKVDVLSSEKEDLSAKVLALTQDVKCKDNQIREMDGHLHQLHLEHVKLITEAEDAQRTSREMKERVEGLKEEVERQQAVITEGAEQKREAIRQLCFSLEHYRDGYRQLRRALQDHRRLPTVLAS
ncbi:hypothetical protein Taro_021496 [Colocasia esculenta]|uniref:NAB domain-containing protein n=1 Tax=Colocasia esculenta TaxID=4460 RepID=A0A843V563_COLES|nr:hypothetical protein [Colocasia esculenta]